MKKIVILFLVSLIFSLSSFIVHKFYVSVTQVDYNEEEQSLQVISRIFIDDLEEVLRKRYNDAIMLDPDKETSNVDTYIKKYLKQKLVFLVDDKETSFIFLGKEYEDDLIICYLEIENIASLKTVKVSNEILMDLFEEQQNIIHVKKETQRKSLILEKGRSEGMLKFSE